MEKQVTRRNKRYKAKRLFFTGKYTSRQIAAMVQVTEATMSKWIKLYGWKDPEAAALQIPPLKAFSIISADFCEHLQQYNPALLKLLNTEILAYMERTSPGNIKSNELKLQIKSLFAEIRITEFAGVTLEQVDSLSSQKAKRLLQQLTVYNQPAVELTIKKVNP